MRASAPLPHSRVSADLVLFWADQVAELPEEAREAMLCALASSHGAAFAERVREALAAEVVAA
ncbi:hypothetical protein ACFP9V_19305 [Deinococcus radiopugnans]|uniref:hypothetical protein n=1 Tax=Deinococcus radiopugnans TaxID=57497 RepID=UPI0036105194